MIQKEINGYSADLQKIVDKHALKSGFATFKLLQGAEPVEAADARNHRFTLERLPSRKRMIRIEQIMDPGTNRPLSIANLKGYVPSAVAGQPLEPTIGEIEFLGAENGEISVPFTDPILYERLLLSDLNQDSPNPSRRVPDLGHWYYLVKPEADAKIKLTKLQAMSRAMSAVAELTQEQVLRSSQKLTLPTEVRGRVLVADELLLNLTALAQTEPERVLLVLDAGENKLTENITDGVALGLIDFVTDTQQWKWKATQEPICDAVQGYKPEEALVNYMQQNANGPAFSKVLARRVAEEKKKKK